MTVYVIKFVETNRNRVSATKVKSYTGVKGHLGKNGDVVLDGEMARMITFPTRLEASNYIESNTASWKLSRHDNGTKTSWKCSNKWSAQTLTVNAMNSEVRKSTRKQLEDVLRTWEHQNNVSQGTLEVVCYRPTPFSSNFALKEWYVRLAKECQTELSLGTKDNCVTQLNEFALQECTTGLKQLCGMEQ